MGNGTLDPRSLNAEERALVDNCALFYRRSTGEVGETAEWAYTAGLEEAEPYILARRAIFGEPASEVGKAIGQYVRIRDGWAGAGRIGKRIGDVHELGQLWVPVEWNDMDDPDWHKLSGLEFGDVPFPEPASGGGKVECPNCHQLVHDAVDHTKRFDWDSHCWEWTCKPSQPEPVAAYHAAPMMGFPCANCGQETLRMDGHVSHRASGDETEYYCDKPAQPEPVAAESEMPDAVDDAVQQLRGLGAKTTRGGKPFSTADALESFWRAHAEQPAPAVAMSPELERVIIAACLHAEARRDFGYKERAVEILRDVRAVRSQAAEAGKVRLPAELEALLRTFASGQGINVVRLRELCRAVFAELDAAEGRK